jgi:hypothetical protein
MNSTLILGFAHPVFAWVGIFLLALFVYGLVKRLFKIAVFLGIATVIAWVVFLAG